MNDKKFRNYIDKSGRQFFAFNVWDINSAREIVNAAADVGVPVIIQISVSSYRELEPYEFCAYIKKYAQKNGAEVYLHLDHCGDIAMIEDAVAAGFDSVMLDASRRPLAENIAMTQRICENAHRAGVAVEGEVGRIAGCEDGVCVCEQGLAELEDIEKYLNHTEVDFLAAAIGTAHGHYKGRPDIRYDMIEKIGSLTERPFVIHGGSGLGNAAFKKLLSCPNVKKVNISTEVKEAYRKGIDMLLNSDAACYDGFNPIRANAAIYAEIRKMAVEKLRLLGELE